MVDPDRVGLHSVAHLKSQAPPGQRGFDGSDT
jgi:hypothetical protein